MVSKPNLETEAVADRKASIVVGDMLKYLHRNTRAHRLKTIDTMEGAMAGLFKIFVSMKIYLN